MVGIHYHLPKWVAAVVGIGSAVAFGAATLASDDRRMWVFGFLTLLAFQDLVRWTIESTPPPLVAVCRFVAATEVEAREVQEVILTSLRDHLQADGKLVRRVPQAVGTADLAFAARVRRGLHAGYLLYGDIRHQPDGSQSIYARVLGLPKEGVIHVDQHSGDAVPQRTAWNRLFHRLTPTSGVEDKEYPFDFTTELETVARGLEGKLLLALNRPALAETSLRATLNLFPNSESHAMDEVRLDLVGALDSQERHDEALALLRGRAEQDTASPDLLMVLAGRLRYPKPASQEDSDEAEALLRRASADRTHPHRDMALYNLMLHLGNSGKEEEGERLLDELLRTRASHYSRAWYVKRLKGSQLWRQGEEFTSTGNMHAATAAFGEAAVWYRRTIVSRPRFKLSSGTLLLPRPGGVFSLRLPTLRVFPVPPVHYGNLADGYERSGRQWRGLLCTYRESALRTRCVRRARREEKRGHWGAAIRNWDQAATGRKDWLDVHALIGCALGEHAIEHHWEEEARLARAEEIDPSARLRYQLRRGRRGL